MTTAHRPRSTRDRPAKAPLSQEAVVDAALTILRSDGLAAVSMRRVATALDTGPGSLYVYVDGRDALVSALFERVIGAVELAPPDPARWREQLHAQLARIRAELVAHPGMAAATMVDPPRTTAAMTLLENLFGLLLAGGLAPQDAAWTADALIAQVSYAAIESEIRNVDPQTLAGEVANNFSALPAEAFPLITAHSAALVSGTADDRFRFAVDALLDGALSR